MITIGKLEEIEMLNREFGRAMALEELGEPDPLYYDDIILLLQAYKVTDEKSDKKIYEKCQETGDTCELAEYIDFKIKSVYGELL